MDYQVVHQVAGRKFEPALNSDTHQPYIFNCPKQAAQLANQMSQALGIKFQVRPIASTNRWQDRERKRFEAGEYTRVLWINEPWWKDIPDHFAHVGIKDKTKIAYTEDAEKGAADRQTTTSPGKYLQKFFGSVLTANQIRYFAMQHANEFEKYELKFATTVEEMKHVYKVGPDGSCFKATPEKATVYASGDFAIAYLQDENGKITARSVCAPERKCYVHPYGDYSRLEALLAKAGYKKKSDADAYAGLRLRADCMWRDFYADWYPNRGYEKHPTDPDYYIVTD